MQSALKRKWGKWFFWLIIASLLLHVLIYVFSVSVFSDWKFEHLTFHATIEAAGSLIAFYVAGLLIVLERRDVGTHYNKLIAAALFSMGILDLFHAITYPGQTFVLLHSLGTFLGGVFFSLVFIPDRLVSYVKRFVVMLSIVLALTISVTVLILPTDFLPMLQDGEFTNAAILLNMVGGGLLLASAARLMYQRKKYEDDQSEIFVIHCLMFGLAALMFQQSSLWDFSWWGWHLLRFLAYAAALWYALYEENEAQFEVEKNRKSLEKSAQLMGKRLGNLNDSYVYHKNMNDTVVASMAESLLICDEGGDIEYFNDNAEQLFGISELDVNQLNIRHLMQPEVASYHDKFLNTFSTDKIYKLFGYDREILGQRSNGETVPLEIRIAEMNYRGKRRFLALIRDLTVQRRYETELISATKKAEEANKAKSEFLATMSHEIRTPLNGVIGMLSLLGKKDLDADSINKINIANQSAHLLMAIINDVLDFSKIEARQMELEESPFNLKDLLYQLCRPYVARAHEKGLEFILDLSRLNHFHLMGDPVRIQQVIGNLVSNAIKFTDKGEVVVRIESKLLGQKTIGLDFLVEDTGIGFDQEQAERLFESFKQADGSTTRKFGGTGLGLAISKRIVNLMGGMISATAVEGEGAKFSFNIHLPIDEDAKRPEPPLNLNELSSLRLAIIDDNETNIQILYEALKDQVGEIFTFTDPIKATKEVETRSDIDVILVDYNMPERNGVELINGYSGNAKAILLSSTVANYTLSDLKKRGFTGCLEKPIDSRKLIYGLLLLKNQTFSDFITETTILSHQTQSLVDFQALPRDKGEVEFMKALVFEDNEINAMIISEILMGQGYQVEIATNGYLGLGKLLMSKARGDAKFDVILMDCQMPIMDGYETTRRIRAGAAGEEYKPIPIIALTANATASDRAKSLEVGMNDHVSKPIDEDELKQKLVKWLPRKE